MNTHNNLSEASMYEKDLVRLEWFLTAIGVESKKIIDSFIEQFDLLDLDPDIRSNLLGYYKDSYKPVKKEGTDTLYDAISFSENMEVLLGQLEVTLGAENAEKYMDTLEGLFTQCSVPISQRDALIRMIYDRLSTKGNQRELTKKASS